ncbi:MAG: N-acetylmuramoyl-L-alanine amidase [Firmicutes bacterium]|nr:N-acetylmuramoyl-L-alanine amidase [Candidatus Fermentithermobacillaceae bacterium]
MKPRILNAWSSVRKDPEGTPVSVISLESTGVPHSIDVERPLRIGPGDYLIRTTLKGVGLTMAEDEILAADGLMRRFAVLRGPSPETVSLEIRAEFETEASFSLAEGMPHIIEITLSGKPLLALMSGRRIAVDPGHGGKDSGVKGPVNLLEKDCTLAIARELAEIIRSCGGVPLLTREDDSYLEPGLRLREVSLSSPELAVEIHLSGERDPLARSYHIRSIPHCPRSKALAGSISKALRENMGIVFGPVEELSGEGSPGFPLARVEPVCLTYFSDEANFRAPLFRRRLAQGIMNGIARYIRASENGRSALL